MADPRPLWILADPVQINQVIIKLVVNAQDAVPNWVQITLTTGHFVMGPDAASTLAPLDPGTYVTLSIVDTGRGMTQEIQAHIFEPFFTTKPPGQGTGLGLSTVYGIVEQSGGRIGFRSAVDAGSVFVIYLRERTAGARGEAGVAEVPRASVRGGSETILLVENDESVRRMVRKSWRAADIGCTDNAAMIASAGYFRYLQGQRDGLDMDVLPNWPLSEV